MCVRFRMSDGHPDDEDDDDVDENKQIDFALADWRRNAHTAAAAVDFLCTAQPIEPGADVGSNRTSAEPAARCK